MTKLKRKETRSEAERLKISFSGIFWGLICIGIGCFLLAGTWGSYLNYNRLQEYGGRSVGNITKKHSQKAADGKVYDNLYKLDLSTRIFPLQDLIKLKPNE